MLPHVVWYGVTRIFFSSLRVSFTQQAKEDPREGSTATKYGVLPIPFGSSGLTHLDGARGQEVNLHRRLLVDEEDASRGVGHVQGPEEALVPTGTILLAPVSFPAA